MKETTKGWQEFWAEFFRIKYRHSIEGIREWDRKLVTHVIEVLTLKEGDRILDLACGGGDQALEFARRGMNVVGVDLARVLVDCGNEAARREKLPVEILEGDIRNVEFSNEFDACVILSGSFGFFDDDDNMRQLKVVEQALKRGGRFYLQAPNPRRKMRDQWKGWDEVDGGYLLMKSDYDPKRGKVVDGFLYVTSDGEVMKFMPTPEDEGFSVETRIYTLCDIIQLLEAANLQFTSAHGSVGLPPEEYTIASTSLIVVAEKP